MSNKYLIILFTGMLSFTYAKAQVSVGFNATEPSCKGIPTGSITASPAGGAGPYAFAWSSGQNTQTIGNILAGEYTVTITDSNGLIATGSITLTEPDEVTVSFETEDCEIPFSITAIGAGGAGGPFTYKWGTGDRTASISVSTPGDYCVTVTDANSCGRVACITVDNTPPVVEVLTQDVNCADDQNGSLTAQVTGGQAPFAFAWSNGGSGATIGGLSPGTYTVTVTDANGCSDSASGTVNAPDPMTALIGANNPVCLMSVNGTLTANVAGGTTPYSYLWNTGATTATISGLGIGTYSVTITDASGCDIEEEILLESLSGLQISVNSEDASCPGVNDGSATVIATEGVSPYMYMWSNGGMTASITDVAPGSYQVTVMDAVGCSQMAFVMIGAADPLDISISSTDASTCGAADGTVSVVVDQGTGPFTYLWNNGATTATVTGLIVGGYQVTVTDANECFVTGLVIVNEPPSISVDVNASATVCEGVADGAADAVVTGGTAPLVYTWSTGENTPQIGGLAAGTYTVTVTDANGCSAIDFATVVATDGPQVEITASTVVCGNQDIGTASANILSGGQAPFTYQWSTNEFTPDISGLSTGTYSVTVTDINGCFGVASTSILITGDIVLDVTPMGAECNGEATASVTTAVTGGTAPYTYLWSDDAGTTDDKLLNVVADIYSVTVTDANGCDASVAVLLSEPEALVLTLSGTETICSGDANALILAQVTGGVMPYEYAWDNGETTPTIENLPGGVYTVTVTDANQCEMIDSWEVVEQANLVANLRTTEFVCGGDGPGVAGEAEVRVEGGAPPYTYTWNTGDATSRVEGLPTGDYSVTVSDALGCTSEVSGRVNIMDSLIVENVITEIECFGESSGAIQLIVTGGMRPYSYDWTTGATDSAIVDLPAGFYAVTVTDAIGCEVESIFFLIEPDLLAIQVTGNDVDCNDLRTSDASVAITGGVEPYVIEWSNGATSETISEINGGTYTVTVTDANECMAMGSITINDFGEPACLILVTQNVTNPSSMDGALSVLAAGGMAPYEFLWSTGQTSEEITGLGPQIYSVTVTDAKGCTSICEVNLAEFIDNAAIGDYAWYDADRDGIQDPDEHGIEGIPIIITPIDDGGREGLDTVYTDMNGRYIIDVVPGKYKLTVIQPDTLRVTSPNMGGDEEDSDFDRGMLMSDTIMIDAGETDLSWDVGFVDAPGMDERTGCLCLNNATDQNNGQFEELLFIEGLPGDTWEVFLVSNAYDINSPEPPALPIPLAVGTTFDEVSPGVYELRFRHVDGETYEIMATNGVDFLSALKVCEYPGLDIDITNAIGAICLNDPPFIPDFLLDFNASVPGELNLTINGIPVENINPGTLGLGVFDVVATLTPTDTDECQAVFPFSIEITNENCPAKIGNFVWLDENEDGIQDPGEPGIANIEVTLSEVDGDNFFDIDVVVTDENGEYCFEVSPGAYKLTFEKPVNTDPTIQNAGDDDSVDSDIDPDMLMTGIITVGDGEMNLSIDAGFIQKCINVGYPGEIAYPEMMICGPGNNPAPIISVAPALGGVGEIEYLWMYSEVTSDFSTGAFIPIPNSNSLSYDPGPLDITTNFARCVRIKGCDDYLEANIVTVIVKDDAKAEIDAPDKVCYMSNIEVNLTTKTDNPIIEWEFPGGITYDYRDRKTVNLGFSSFGNFTIKVTVTENGCRTTSTHRIIATLGAEYCEGINFDVEAEGLAETHEVRLSWETLNDGTDYRFEVQHSPDGLAFNKIAEVSQPLLIKAGYRQYEYVDQQPKMGRNLYRVKMMDNLGAETLSNLLELMMFDPGTQIMLYPNPVQDKLMLEFAQKNDNPIEIELISTEGLILRTFTLEPNTIQQRLDFSQFPGGIYFLRIKIGTETTEVMRVMKKVE